MRKINVVLLGSSLLLAMSSAIAHEERVNMDYVFNSGNVCGGDFLDARATIKVDQSNGSTKIKIKMKDAMPNAIYTVWLRLKDASPITGGKSTALAPVASLGDLIASAGSGFDAVAHGTVTNGFVTDHEGNGRIRMKIKSPIIKGSYRFEEYDASMEPVLIDNPGNKFTIRIASHCTDNMTHGLGAGVNQKWFNWFF